MFIDTHCHLFSSYYSDIDKVIKSAKFNLVTYYINNGSDYESNKEILKLIDKYDSMYGALGIHPEEVEKYLCNDVPFWSNSYFIATTGTTVMEKVKEYIESQRTDEHKRKYTKTGKYKKAGK